MGCGAVDAVSDGWGVAASTTGDQGLQSETEPSFASVAVAGYAGNGPDLDQPAKVPPQASGASEGWRG